MENRINEINEVVYEKSKSVMFNSYNRIGTEVLSNLHICRLEYDGKVFNSSEQLFWWGRLSGYAEYQEELLRCKTPKEVKKKGTSFIKKLGIVDDIKRDVQMLRLAIQVKYNCCEEFKKLIDKHPDKHFVEYAWWGDTTYGCIDENADLKYNWKEGFVRGRNVCGRIISGVSKQVKDAYGKVAITLPDCLKSVRPQLLFR